MFTAGQYGTFGIGMQITSALMGGVGAFYSAKAQREALRTQATLDTINARIMEQGAQSVLLQGQSEVGRLGLKVKQLKGSQRAAMAANGIDLGVGNAAEITASTDLMKEIDSNTIEANAVRSAFGYRTQAVNLQNDALVKRATASTMSPVGSAVGSLLGGASQVASSWYGLNKIGALDELKANLSSDPIGALGDSRGWWKE
jgi:hypothetical protein